MGTVGLGNLHPLLWLFAQWFIGWKCGCLLESLHMEKRRGRIEKLKFFFFCSAFPFVLFSSAVQHFVGRQMLAQYNMSVLEQCIQKAYYGFQSSSESKVCSQAPSEVHTSEPKSVCNLKVIRNWKGCTKIFPLM